MGKQFSATVPSKSEIFEFQNTSQFLFYLYLEVFDSMEKV